jgi:hypothetical protein
MDFRNSLIAPCAIQSEENRDVLDVDLAALVTRLLLFDKYILQSIRLLEFPEIVKVCGLGGTLDLLSSKALKLQCDVATFGQTGQLAVLESRSNKGLLPLGSFSFSIVRGANREQYLHKVFQNLQPRIPLALKDIIKLKRAILDSLIDTPQGFGDDTMSQTTSDFHMGKVEVVKILLAKVLLKNHAIKADPNDLELTLHSLDETDFRMESNLRSFGLDERAAHRSVEAALLAVFGLNQPIEEMKAFNALSGCIDDECPLFMDRLGFLLRDLRPQSQEKNFQRIVNLAGMPEFLPRVDAFDVDAILRVRDSSELVEFRSWLRGASALADQEIYEQIAGVRSRIADVGGSLAGRLVRFIVMTGAGFIEPTLGVSVGAIDSFLIDKVLPKSGIWTFVNRLYPSIFKRNAIDNLAGSNP